MPQKRRIAIGCYVSLCHLSYGPTFMFVLVQRHEIVGIAVRLATCVRCAMIRLSLQAPLHQLAVLRLLARMAPGDALLVKASRGMALEKALALFYPVCAK